MERMPLSSKEYYALREIFGIVNAFEACQDALRARCGMIPGAWRDMRMISVRARKLAEALTRTIPLKKLESMQKDLECVRCEVKIVKDFTGKAKEQGFSYVPEKAIERLAERVINWECTCCDRSRVEGKKCPIRQDIEAVYPWPMPPRGEKCPLSGLSSLMEGVE